MKVRIWPVLALLGIVLVSSGAALAHKGATGIVKQRMELMKGIAEQMKALKPMMDGKAAYDPAGVAKAAEAIAAHATRIAQSFPKGSTEHPSEASPKIWTDWDGFEASAEALRKHASALKADAGKGAGAAKALFAEMAKTCKGCHEGYRVKKQ